MKRFFVLSLAARIAWAVAFLLCFVVLMTLLVVLITGGAAVFEAWWTPAKAASLVVLLCLIPTLVFYSARLWFHHESTFWNDIEKAWSEVLVELDRQGIALSSTPLFIVLGGDGGPRESALLSQSKISFDVQASPPGSAPFHVYASAEGVFVCLSTVGQTCTILSRDGIDAHTAVDALRADERAEASDRLRTLCERIRSARQPIAPANGVIALVPAAHSEHKNLGNIIGSALSEDLLTLTLSFGLRMPLTLVGFGVEAIPGFKTLLQRLPADTDSIPMGEPFPVGRIATENDIQVLTMAACGRLADKTGGLLLDLKSLSHPQENRRLVNLLCQLRLEAAPLLESTLRRSLDYTAHSDAKPTLAGCYLLPVHIEKQTTTFSAPILSRALEVQGDLEWTSETLERDRRYGYIARTLIALNTLMAAACIAILWWRFSQ